MPFYMQLKDDSLINLEDDGKEAKTFPAPRHIIFEEFDVLKRDYSGFAIDSCLFSGFQDHPLDLDSEFMPRLAKVLRFRDCTLTGYGAKRYATAKVILDNCILDYYVEDDPRMIQRSFPRATTAVVHGTNLRYYPKEMMELGGDPVTMRRAEEIFKENEHCKILPLWISRQQDVEPFLDMFHKHKLSREIVTRLTGDEGAIEEIQERIKEMYPVRTSTIPLPPPMPVTTKKTKAKDDRLNPFKGHKDEGI